MLIIPSIMTSSMGRRILIKLYGSRLNIFSPCISTAARYAVIKENAVSARSVSSASQSEKIQNTRMSAAVLKEFSNPLVIEDLKLPKKVHDNEVSSHYRCKIKRSV